MALGKTKSKSASKSKTASKDCKKGEIFRKAYTRKTGSKTIKVKGDCIKATSQSGMKRSVGQKVF